MPGRFSKRFRITRHLRPSSASNHRIILFVIILLSLSVLILLPGSRLFSKQHALPSFTETRVDSNTDNTHAKSEIGVDDGWKGHHESNAIQERLDISIVVLFHNEYPTLNHTLQSWEENNLFVFTSEVLIFLNGIPSTDEFYNQLPHVRHAPWFPLLRLVPSAENMPLGLAISEMVSLAISDHVLLLEKDWALIEPEEKVAQTLTSAQFLIDNEIAHVVRFRHRHRPGAPLHARIMHENREPQMLSQQSNLFCYMHHWVADPTISYPEYFSRCTDRPAEAETWCSKAMYCQWTNNPALFKKSWFMSELGEPFEKKYEEIVKQDPKSHMLDFEFFTNWQADVWNDRNFTVALPVGLFEHQEIGEQNLMNTVWYGWNRLNTDIVERSRAMLKSENDDCQSETKSREWGERYASKYPVEFVRMYHYDRAMTHSMDEALTELEAKSNMLSKQMADGGGNWRSGITELTNFWYTVVLYAYPVEPTDMKIAFVTALFRLKESDAVDGAFQADVDRLADNLNALGEYSALVYCDAETKMQVELVLRTKHGWKDTQLEMVEFQVSTVEETVRTLLSEQLYDAIGKIAETEDWQTRVRERNEGVVPSTMSVRLSIAQPYMVHAASKVESIASRATHFVWLDGTTRCINVTENWRLTADTDTVLRAHMLLDTMLSGVRAKSRAEVETALAGSGFSAETLLEEMEKRTQDDIGNGVVVVDGMTIGGSKLALALMKGYYDFVLRDMLRKGQLGTQREALSIARNNVEYNFQFVDGRTACRGGPGGGAACDGIGAAYFQVGSNEACAVYAWAAQCVAKK